MKISVPDNVHNLPLILEPDPKLESTDLRAWCAGHTELMDELLLNHGAILFRGFGIRTAESFEQLVRGLSDDLCDYVDGNSPRSRIGSNVYTSTEYPPEYFISLHNELSYAGRWPERLYFCCITAAEQGGGTALADCRRILRDLPPSIVAEFKEKQIRYLRYLHGGTGFGRSWQETFETADQKIVDDYLTQSGTTREWKADGALRLSCTRPATAYHPQTGKEIWFNQADQFHPSTHPTEIYEMMMFLYQNDVERLPQHVTFGDGSPIPEATLNQIRATVARHTTDCQWQAGDFLIVDNMLVCHGRMPFTGKRQVLVAMSGCVTWPEVTTPQKLVSEPRHWATLTR